jgi:hypothetical protein
MCDTVGEFHMAMPWLPPWVGVVVAAAPTPITLYQPRGNLVDVLIVLHTFGNAEPTRIRVPAGSTVELIMEAPVVPSVSRVVSEERRELVQGILRAGFPFSSDPDDRLHAGLVTTGCGGAYRVFGGGATCLILRDGPIARGETPPVLGTRGLVSYLQGQVFAQQAHSPRELCWNTPDGSETFTHVAFAFDQPQRLAELLDRLAYIAVPLGLRDEPFQVVAAPGSGETVHLLVVEWNLGASMRSDPWEGVRTHLLQGLAEGTPIRRTNRAGMGTRGTRAFAAIQGGFALAFGS